MAYYKAQCTGMYFLMTKAEAEVYYGVGKCDTLRYSYEDTPHTFVSAYATWVKANKLGILDSLDQYHLYSNIERIAMMQDEIWQDPNEDEDAE